MKKRCLFISHISYPFGGGESFCHQAVEWVKEVGYEVAWISFRDALNGPYTQEIITRGEYLDIRIPFSHFKKWVIFFSPSVVHVVPERNPEWYALLEELNIPTILGYHFWNSLLLDDKRNHIHIDMKNNDSLIIDPLHLLLRENPLFSFYVASDFMNEIVESVGGMEMPVIYPTSSHHICDLLPWEERKYITAINIHPLKGGRVISSLVKSLPYPFNVVVTDPHPEDVNITDNNNVTVSSYTDIRDIYKLTRVLLVPTLLDETFCRVAYEGASLGIPVVTTGNGFVREMLGESGIYLSPEEDWKEKVRELYESRELNQEIGERQKLYVERLSHNKEKFLNLLRSSEEKCRANNVMIFCPWGDQGLGIQSRIYRDYLEKDYNIHIFSYKSYFSNSEKYQFSPEEWEHSSVYYSLNEREQVSPQELTHFVKSRRIGKCVIPEVCNCFSLFEHLRSLGVQLYAVPNSEIVKRSELPRYSIFEKVLCPTKFCYQLLSKYMQCYHLSHPLRIPEHTPKKELTFLHVAGYNAVTRKNTPTVLKTFLRAASKRTDIKLIVTVSGAVPDCLLGFRSPSVQVILKPLKHSEVVKLYQSVAASIQVSTHEGLGLGFYESLENGTPVVTVDTAPHNEIITEARGWRLPGEEFILTDNPEAIVRGCRVSEEALENFFLTITLEEINSKLFESDVESFREMFAANLVRFLS